jgi:hypothetical protein
VHYTAIGAPDNAQGFEENLRRIFGEVGATRFEHQEPDEWRLDRALASSRLESAMKTA